MRQPCVILVMAIQFAGCQAGAPSGASATHTPPAVYHCTDGRTVLARYPTTDTAALALQGQTYTLRIAVSASGARYVGDGWQWWTKGMHEARLAPLERGESHASTPALECTAP